jgi:uncharacterized protein YfdQ (DUF2303 family)
MSDPQRTEVDAAAEYAVASLASRVGGEGWGFFIVPEGYESILIDETHGGRRSHGTIEVHNSKSFLDAVAQRRTGEVTVYAAEDTHALVAILNDDYAEAPGRRDYRIDLELRRTPEWRLWLSLNDKPLSQQTFAEHIEERAADFVDPTAADMLEMAQSIEGTTQAKFGHGIRLANGDRQFTYSEETTARAGSSGTLTIPSRFTIALRLFQGGDVVQAEALLRFRLREGHLVLQYKLVDPEELERKVFEGIVTDVESALTGDKVLYGSALHPAQ